MPHTVSSILSDETLNRIIAIESAGKLRAKAPTSSAFGLFQFLNGTWMATVKKHRPDLMHGKSQAQVLALRADGSICIELGARFTEDNAAALGTGYTDGDLYLAHFLGAGSARKVLRSNPSQSAVAVCGQQAANANKSIFYKNGKPVSCMQLRRWAQLSMEHRWDTLGNHDWIAQYYTPPEGAEPMEATDDETPVKHEDNFEVLDDLPEEPPVRQQEPAVAVDDGFFASAKSLFKSKIAWLASGLGGTGAASTVSGDPDLQGILMRLVQKPAFWLMVAAIGLTVAVLYYRWKDHGRGAS